MLSRRFEIQDIVAQDSFGVTFHALDTQTGTAVAVQRFFPFGADGGGLFDEERSDYATALAQLVGLRHPGLRAVLAGGCDPVDGMPFVATEWIDGEPLADMLQRGSFTPGGAVAVLDRALELSAALSYALGVDAVWVETAPELIIADAGADGRGLIFSLAPLKWIGCEVSRRSLSALAELADDLLGWRGKKVLDQAGQGLGAWVKWLRVNADVLTLAQAREGLAGFAEALPVEAPQPAARPDAPPVIAMPPGMRNLPQPAMASLATARLKKSPAKEPWFLITALAVVVVAAGWWVVKHPVAHGARKVPAPATQPATSPVTPAAAVTAQPAEGDLPGGVLRSGDTERIMQQKGHEVSVEGVLKNIRASGSDKTLYLEFGETPQQEVVRGYFQTKNQPDEMSELALKSLQGKRVRIAGVVKNVLGHANWPELLLKDRQSIQEVK